MENMTDKEICNFVQAAIKTLEEEKKEEVMKCVGEFVHNPRIDEINTRILQFATQCKHLDIKPNGRCAYCNTLITSTR